MTMISSANRHMQVSLLQKSGEVHTVPCNVIANERADCSSVKGIAERAESLVACCVP